MKTCCGCKEEKPFDCFAKSKTGKYGLQNYCRGCQKKHRKKHYEANKEHEREQNRQWHIQNKPWLDDEKREYINTWRRQPGVRKAEHSRRDARMRGAEGSFSQIEWTELCSKYGNICLRCKRGDVALTVDHVMPISLGGSNYIDNIQPLCGRCNSSKGAQYIDYR